MLEFKGIFHAINVKRKIYFNELLENYSLNMMEVEILATLSECPDNNTFTDIMKMKDYAKSYISKAISNLVERGYIEKRTCENNKKVYNLFLLESSEPIIKQYNECVENFRNDAMAGLKKDQIRIFEQVISKINENLSQN